MSVMAAPVREMLEKRRDELGMPVAVLSRRSGVPEQRLRKLLSGDQIPSEQELSTLIKSLEVRGTWPPEVETR